MSEQRKPITQEQAAVGREVRTKRRERQGVKNVLHFTGNLRCGRCGRGWFVSDLNPERKVVPCPVDGEPNDIKEAIKRAA
jgi:hypothetical protein